MLFLFVFITIYLIQLDTYSKIVQRGGWYQGPLAMCTNMFRVLSSSMLHGLKGRALNVLLKATVNRCIYVCVCTLCCGAIVFTFIL